MLRSLETSRLVGVHPLVGDGCGDFAGVLEEPGDELARVHRQPALVVWRRRNRVLVSPVNNEKWVCIPDPCARRPSGFGMNEACTPRSCAISLMISRTVMIVSAIVRASV